MHRGAFKHYEDSKGWVDGFFIYLVSGNCNEKNDPGQKLGNNTKSHNFCPIGMRLRLYYLLMG